MAQPSANPAGSSAPAVSLQGVRPRVLLLDEPLGGLDLKLHEQMQIELKGIQKDVGIMFLFVTHDQDEALTMSDRLAVFNEGRIDQIGSPAEVYESPVAGFVGTGGTPTPTRSTASCAGPITAELRRLAGRAYRPGHGV